PKAFLRPLGLFPGAFTFYLRRIERPIQAHLAHREYILTDTLNGQIDYPFRKSWRLKCAANHEATDKSKDHSFLRGENSVSFTFLQEYFLTATTIMNQVDKHLCPGLK
ncbi:MAG TPA: hypothetical protein PLG78_19360, partial [Leptospiraceae bacterium]|nr:hypothetical protein [Leptospiraceae bacterium]